MHADIGDEVDEDDAEQRDDRSDRQLDAPGDDDERLASENRPNRPIRLAVFERLIGDRKRGLMVATMAPTIRMSRRRPRSFFSIDARAPRCRWAGFANCGGFELDMAGVRSPAFCWRGSVGAPSQIRHGRSADIAECGRQLR